jgi:hypothetical protein
MNRLVKLISAGMFGMLTTDVGAAQQQVPTAPAAAQKTQPNTGYMGPINQTPWFSNPAVRQQLNLNDTQFNQLSKAHMNAWTQYQQNLQNMDTANANLTPEQRIQRIQDFQLNYYKGLGTPVNDVFTDPQMRERYYQLHTQYRGYDALLDPSIQAKLSLTDAQRQRLGQYQQDWRNSMGELQKNYQTDPQGSAQRLQDLRQREAERTNAVLSEQQRQMWQQMVGNPYNFQPSVYFPSAVSPAPR